jgi:hypothetical protein
MLAFVLILLVLVQSKPIFFIAVARHGARTPLEFMPWDDDLKWPEGPNGQITAEGLRQEYLLGQYLRQKYMISSNLLTGHQSEVSVFSTNMIRTQLSAQALSFGLFKDNVISIIDPVILPHKSIDTNNYSAFLLNSGQAKAVQMNPYKVDSLLLPPESCEELIEYMEKKSETVSMKKIFLKYKDVLSPIMKHFKASLSEAIKRFERVYDSVVSNRFHSFFVPIEFDDTWLERAEKLYIEKRIFLRYHTDYFAKYSGSRFLRHIIKSLEEKAGNRGGKGLIYAGHDSTLQDLLIALKIYDGKHPPFASMIIFELNQEEKGDFYVKILYNNKELFIPGLKTTAKLEVFSNYTKERTFIDSADACAKIQFLEMKTEHAKDEGFISLLTFNCLIMSIVLVLIKYLIKK